MALPFVTKVWTLPTTSSTFGTSATWSVTWSNWTNDTTSSTDSTACAPVIWQAWNDGTRSAVAYTGGLYTAPITFRPAPGWSVWVEENDEQKRARHVMLAATVQREAADRIERALAAERAEKLLRESLTPAQLIELTERNHFHLETLTAAGERRRYRIQRGRSGNVKQVDDAGKVIKTLCAHPMPLVPDADTMLTQKLWLETDEAAFLRVANHS